MTRDLIAGIVSAALVAACGAGEHSVLSTTPTAAAAQAAGPIAAPASLPDAPDQSVAKDADGRPLDYALLGQKLPAFVSVMADGSIFDSAAIDRWTVIAVWGAWCSDSRADGLHADALSRAIAADPELDFVTIHVPQDAARTGPKQMFGKYGSLESYFESAGTALPTVLDTDGSLRAALRINWTPTYLVVSPGGVVRGFRTDLSIDKDQPVKAFIKDIARLRSEEAGALLVMSPAGVGALGQRTPFTVSAVETAFPGHTVIPLADPATGMATFDVRPAGGDTARFVVEPDWTRGYVAIVRSRDPAVRGPSGETIGKTVLGDLAAESRALCKSPEARRLVCPDPVSPAAFTRVYALKGGGAPESAAVLVELRYHAPPP